ncbi:MAG: cyclic nucleotide-binding domain-containing protein [Hormoscilla sp. GM7CHS1pb]|nr:cyclic nucleotide-binding domain-containing protein [Hormoscilla sp. GM7CHS1pb]
MLENFKLLANLNDRQRQEVEKVCLLRSYEEGEYIIKEGESTTDIYFLISGKVEIYKIEPNTQNNLKFKEMSSGESFGEMSFVDGSPRSSSVKAATPIAVYVLSKQALLDRVSDPQETLNILGATIIHQVNDYLRSLSDRHIMAIQKQIDELKERNRFGVFFVSTVIFLFAITILNAVLDDFFPNYNVASRLFNWAYLFIFTIFPIFLALKKLKLSLAEIGVTRKNLKKSVLDGLIFSFIGILGTYSLSWLIDFINPDLQLREKFLQIYIPLTAGIYFIHCWVQEFGRATLQIALQKFFQDQKGYYAILITSLLFAMAHFHLGTRVIVVSWIASNIFGLIYNRTYNLVGVTLVHFVMGCILYYFALQLM